MSNIDTSRFLTKLLRLIDDLELLSHDGPSRVREYLREHDPSARECIKSLAASGKGTEGYVGIVNEVHRRLAGAEARGLDPQIVAKVVLALVEFDANPFVALRTLGTEHALLSPRASSRLICDGLSANVEGYVGMGYLDADDVEPLEMNGLRTVAIRVGGSRPADESLFDQVQTNIFKLAGMQGPGIEALLGWHHFISWLRQSSGAVASSGAALAALDESVLTQLMPAAMAGDSRTSAIRRGLAIDEAVRALVQVARGHAATLREKRIGFASASELFESFRAFVFAVPSDDGALPSGLLDEQTLAAVERSLAAAAELRLPSADPVGPSLRETQRRLRYLARVASSGLVDQTRVLDLLFPIGHNQDEREAYRFGFERVSEAEAESRISQLLERAGSDRKRVRALRLMAQMEVDTFSPSLDSAAPAAFLEKLVEIAGGLDDEESDLASEVFSQEFIARAAGYLLRSYGEGDPAIKARKSFFTERQSGFDASALPLVASIKDGDQREFRRILRANFHREFDLSKIVSDVVPLFVGVAADDPCRRDFASWATPAVFDGAASGGELATFGALAAMSSDELIGEARSRPREKHGIFRVPVAHAICYMAGAGKVSAREALVALADVALTPPALLRQLWVVEPDVIGRTSGFALAAACCKQALASLTRPTVEPGVRDALLFSRSTADGVTALMAAARSASNECEHRMEGFNALLAAREALGLGSLDARDNRGWRAIHHAVASGNTEVARALMSAGSSVAIEEGDGTSVLIEAFDCSDQSRYAFSVWFVSGAVLPAMKQQSGGKVSADVFRFGHDRVNHKGMPRTVANVGIINPHYLRFVQFASEHPDVWGGLTAEAVNWMFTADSGVDRFRMVADLSPQQASAAVGDAAIFALMRSLRPRGDADSISGTVDIIDALRRIKALRVDGNDSQRRSVFHVLASRLKELPRRFSVSASDQCSLVRALLGANPSAHERAVSHADLDGRSSVVSATSGGQVLLALLLSRALAARDPSARHLKIQGAARLIHNPGQLAQLVSDGGMGMLQLSPAGEVLLACGDQVVNLGQTGQGAIAVDAPREVRNVVDWLSRQDVQAAIETNLAKAFVQPNFAVTFDDFVAWLDHLAKSR